MAIIVDLPTELLFCIIFLLVPSSDGAADLASSTSVCRSFLVLARDVRILRNVNFDIELGRNNLSSFQNINGLLVRCSEAGNMAAGVFLGKVLLMSTSQLLLSEWRKANLDARPSGLAMLSQIVARRLPAQNSRVVSFINNFVPKQASTSESSHTRLLHNQLVRLFLLNGSHREIIEMDAFLKYYIKYFSESTEEDVCLLNSVKVLVSHANRVREMEELDKMSEMLNDAYRTYMEVALESEEKGFEFRCLLYKFAHGCHVLGVDCKVGLSNEARSLKHHLDAAL